MRELFPVIRDLCLLRRGPQDLPYAPHLPALLGLALIVLQVLAGGLRKGVGEGLAGGVLSVLFMLGALYALLALRGQRARYVQAAGALLGVLLAFSLLALPLALLMGPNVDVMHPTALQMLLIWPLLGLAIWQLCAIAHVLRHALDVPFAGGVLLALLLGLGNYVLVQATFPA
ncbi:MAG: hypothetical protein ABFC67_07005 [Mizugakiibacter sp.]|uniref:hypothetical protein n=1 Tax=Mizugakiibacter sp. TaxID=1972610 RepID=UPI0031BFB1FE|nr:hypothetical protein [Xanthomonadaceae bacterium]